MTVIRFCPVLVVSLTVILPAYTQISFPIAHKELNPNVPLPQAETPEVVSELYEPDRNKSSVLNWLLGFVNGGNAPNPKPTNTVSKDCAPCTCGLTNKNHRIVGGHETEHNEYPWMTLLRYRGVFYCAGSLICNKYVLTAAHCVNGFSQEKITLEFKVHDRNNILDVKIFSRTIKYIVRHQRYDPKSFNNDIALLRLDKDIVFEHTMRPVCLPTLGKSFTGKQAVVTGWGALSEGGPLATKLHEVTVNIFSNDDCKKTGYGQKKITENMMCAGWRDGKKDSCQGDSGGPLHYINSTVHSIVGIVSWGDGCAKPNYPGVYTRVNRYITWIKTNTPDCCYCTQEVKKKSIINGDEDEDEDEDDYNT